jgi:hypothetical protein
VAVSTQGLQINGVIVGTVSVYVVYIELTGVFWDKPAVFTGILLVDSIWILVLLYVSFVNSLAAEATSGS